MQRMTKRRTAGLCALEEFESVEDQRSTHRRGVERRCYRHGIQSCRLPLYLMSTFGFEPANSPWQPGLK